MYNPFPREAGAGGLCTRSPFNERGHRINAMLFNSSEFFVFFPIVAALYFALPHRWRWSLLLATSYFFYMCWEPGYVLLLIASTLISFMAGGLIGSTFNERWRRIYLIAAIVGNLGLLFYFKYYNFFAEALQPLIPFQLPASRFLLPLGISFYTLQALSYVFEVYLGRELPERHIGRFALYVAFFPQLVAGPIERPGNLLPQLRRHQEFHYDRVTDGLKLIGWGLFKKMVIADRLAILVDHVYADPTQYEGLPLVVATVCFAFQIFCDFSGYSDIAIGAARVLGIKLMANFWRPYAARSVADFWRRWHISLSTWFRDYLYIPLGGSRVRTPRWCLIIFVVFLVSGLWHGANWTFLVWGGLHALYMLGGRFLQPARARVVGAIGLDRRPLLHAAVQWAITFSMVCFAWIFFRANTLSDAIYIVTHLFQGWGLLLSPQQIPQALFSIGLTSHELLFIIATIGLLEVVHYGMGRGSVLLWIVDRPIYVRWAFYCALVWSILLFGVFQHKEFYYFTF